MAQKINYNSLNNYGYDNDSQLSPFHYVVGITSNEKMLTITDGKLTTVVKLDEERGILSLLGVDNTILSSIELPNASLIKEAYFDKGTNEIVIKIELSDGTLKEVRFTLDLGNYASVDYVNEVKELVIDEANRAIDIESDLRIDVDGKINTVELVHDTTDSLHYTLMVDSVNKGEISIPKDQFLKSASYDETTKELVFVFDTESGETTTRIDVSNLVDTYISGNGLSLASNVFSIDEAIVATNDSVDAKLALKQDVGDYSTKTELVDGLNTKVENTLFNTFTATTNTSLDGKANTVHIHIIGDITDLQSTLDGKQAVGDYATKAELMDGLATKQDEGDYATKTELSDGLDSKANTLHNHLIDDIVDLQNILDDKQDVGDYATNVDTNTKLSTKQDTLVSGVNIKTINGEDLLGTGDIEITSGGGSSYTIGSGLELTAPDVLSIKLNPSLDRDNYLSLDSDGLLLSGIGTALSDVIITCGNNAIDISKEQSKIAKDEAIVVSSLDATTKSNLAKNEAISVAALDVDEKLIISSNSIKADCATDASTKATNAKTEAIATSSLEIVSKINDVKTDMGLLVTAEKNRAIGIEDVLRSDVNSKVSVVELSKDVTNEMHYSLLVDGIVKGDINIPTNQFLKEADYNSVTKELIFTFATSTGDVSTNIGVADLVDTYLAGDGIIETLNKFSINIDPSTEGYLSVSSNGLKVSGINKAINDLSIELANDLSLIDTKINTESTRAIAAESTNSDNLDKFKIEIKTYVDTKFNEILASITALSNRITVLENKKNVLSNGIRNIVPMTKAEYDSLLIKDNTTLYTVLE